MELLLLFFIFYCLTKITLHPSPFTHPALHLLYLIYYYIKYNPSPYCNTGSNIQRKNKNGERKLTRNVEANSYDTLAKMSAKCIASRRTTSQTLKI